MQPEECRNRAHCFAQLFNLKHKRLPCSAHTSESYRRILFWFCPVRHYHQIQQDFVLFAPCVNKIKHNFLYFWGDRAPVARYLRRRLAQQFSRYHNVMLLGGILCKYSTFYSDDFEFCGIHYSRRPGRILQVQNESEVQLLGHVCEAETEILQLPAAESNELCNPSNC